MVTVKIALSTFGDCFRNSLLWRIQFFANPILFALFAAWVFIPVASGMHLVVNVICALLLLAAVLTLHAGTMNYCYDRLDRETAPLWPGFRRAWSHIIPVAICVGIFCLAWLLVGGLESNASRVTTYVRSSLLGPIRRHVSLSALDDLFSALVFTVRWILVPGLLLPLFAQAANRGFHGFGKQALTLWKQTVFNLGYWFVVLFVALLGVFVTQKLMAWVPNFKTSTLHLEAVSLILRLSISYWLALFSWMLTCSLFGRCAAGAESSTNVSRKSIN